MNIGMVLATQAPSSIMPEILSETDNWILAYLNSENERKVISGHMMILKIFWSKSGKLVNPVSCECARYSSRIPCPFNLTGSA